jgi:hypothetical protein
VVDAVGRLIAVGELVTGGIGGVWASSDGIVWRGVSGSASFDGASLTSIARIPGGIIASGSKGTDAAAWISPDGDTWTSLDDQEAFHDAYITAMVATGERLVAVGATQDRIAGTNSFNQAATAWVSTPLARVAP